MPTFGYEFEHAKFGALITDLIAKYPVTSILETGTYLGSGTTQILAHTGLPVKTIECNPSHHQQAVLNLREFPNVECLLGYSLGRTEMEDFVQNDLNFVPPDSIMTDVENDQKINFYLGELRQGDLPENLLTTNLKTNQLVFLDSAGGVGWLEFQAVLKSETRPILLVMDDVFHYKHFRSASHLMLNGFPYETHDRWGFCYLTLQF